MKRVTLLYLLLILFYSLSNASNGHEITVHLDGFDNDKIMLGYYLMDKQYLQDTAYKADDNSFTFKGDEELKPGVYLIILPPENSFFQILINPGEQHFTVHTATEKSVENFKVTGSAENQRFYEYLNFLNAQRPEADEINKEIAKNKEEGKSTKNLEGKLQELNDRVIQYQKDLVAKYPASLSAAIIKSTFEVEIPEFEEENDNELKKKRYYYYKNHYFDNINLSDARMLRSPVLFNKVNDFIEKIAVQHPDSIAASLDVVLEGMKNSEETFKFYLVHYLNKYAQSKIVGMDAIYVHLVEKYYATGMASWTDEEQLTKIIDNATTLKPLLIGKIAPDIPMQILDIEGTIAAKDAENEYQRFKTKSTVALHEVKAPYTVLVFWAPDCGHCKKSMPKLLEFYKEYKDKGVAVYSVCTKTYKDMPDCAKFVKENNLESFYYNMVDPFFRTKFKTIYDVKTTPQVYLLDEKKEILTKKIGVEQLGNIIDSLIELKNKEKADSH